MNHQITSLLSLLVLSWHVNGQMLMEKTEFLFNEKKELIEKSQAFYNAKGQLVNETQTSYGNEKYQTFTDYEYNSNGRLEKETFTGSRCYSDSLNQKHWTEPSNIYTKRFIYNQQGQLHFEKEYSFQCNQDTCDVTEFFYDGKRLIRKFCTSDCSLSKSNFNYPIYYQYDKNDSLILEQAWGPLDTTEIWYANTFEYQNSENTLLKKSFYREDDSLRLKDFTLSKTEYLEDGRKSKVMFLSSDQSHDSFSYYKNGLLKAAIRMQNGIPTSKSLYRYNRKRMVKKLEVYHQNDDLKLKLDYFQTYKYQYFEKHLPNPPI